MRLIVAILAALISTAAFAQQQQDLDFLKRALAAMLAPRNLALDSAAIAEAKQAGLADELAKAQARIKEIEPMPPKK
jgi:hypothetical protein